MTKKTGRFDGAYLQLADVSADVSDTETFLRVSFRNGDHVTLATSKLVPRRSRSAIRWNDARPSTFGTVITVPAEEQDLEIPSELIRQLTDSRFANHAMKVAERQARLLGPRLRALRERSGASQVTVARRAGIEPANLSRIEAGRFDISSTTLWKLLAALGCTLSDLASSEPGNKSRSGDSDSASVSGGGA